MSAVQKKPQHNFIGQFKNLSMVNLRQKVDLIETCDIISVEFIHTTREYETCQLTI